MSVAHFEETRWPNAGLARVMDSGSSWQWHRVVGKTLNSESASLQQHTLPFATLAHKISLYMHLGVKFLIEFKLFFSPYFMYLIIILLLSFLVTIKFGHGSLNYV